MLATLMLRVALLEWEWAACSREEHHYCLIVERHLSAARSELRAFLAAEAARAPSLF